MKCISAVFVVVSLSIGSTVQAQEPGAEMAARARTERATARSSSPSAAELGRRSATTLRRNIQQSEASVARLRSELNTTRDTYQQAGTDLAAKDLEIQQAIADRNAARIARRKYSAVFCGVLNPECGAAQRLLDSRNRALDALQSQKRRIDQTRSTARARNLEIQRQIPAQRRAIAAFREALLHKDGAISEADSRRIAQEEARQIAEEISANVTESSDVDAKMAELVALEARLTELRTNLVEELNQLRQERAEFQRTASAATAAAGTAQESCGRVVASCGTGQSSISNLTVPGASPTTNVTDGSSADGSVTRGN